MEGEPRGTKETGGIYEFESQAKTVETVGDLWPYTVGTKTQEKIRIGVSKRTSPE